MRLDELLTLRTSSIYQYPQRSGEKLSIVGGDFLGANTRGGADDPGGCLPTVCIDRLNLVYQLSDCAIVPGQAVEIYFQQNSPTPVLQDPSTYTFYSTLNYEGQGNVAIVQFTLASVLDGTVTWRGQGAISETTGTLITDPTLFVYLLFTTRGNWKTTDFDPLTLARAQGVATAYGIPFHYAITEDLAYGQILTDIYENYLADIRLTQNGQLAIDYNLWPMEPIHYQEIAQPYLNAVTDCAGDDPEDAVELTLDRENLVNEVIVRWRHNFATNEQRAERDFVYTPSRDAYKLTRVREFTLKGIRLQTHLDTWLQLFLSPLVENPLLITIPLKAMLPYLHMQRGSYVALTWSAGPDPLNRGWTNRVLRVLETRTNYLSQTHELTCFDTKFDAIPPQAVVFLDQSGTPWYLRIKSEDGTLEFVSTDTLKFPWRIASSTGRHWVTRLSPTGTTVYVYPDTDGTVLSSTSQPGTGSGNAAQVDLVDDTMRHWDIQVGASPGYAVTTRVRNLGIKLIGVT